jgi:hypothetical protein
MLQIPPKKHEANRIAFYKVSSVAVNTKFERFVTGSEAQWLRGSTTILRKRRCGKTALAVSSATYSNEPAAPR